MGNNVFKIAFEFLYLDKVPKYFLRHMDIEFYETYKKNEK